MRLTKKRQSTFIYFSGKSKGFLFSIKPRATSLSKDLQGFYVTASHQKKDIRFNSLWEQLYFDTVEKAKEFCENFDPKKHSVLGDGKLKEEYKKPEKEESKKSCSVACSPSDYVLNGKCHKNGCFKPENYTK